ncbi:MAG: dUTP diphosphatase [Candidatus Binataceae bacterium]
MAVAVKIQRLRGNSAPLPRYQSERAAGLDLTADLAGGRILQPLERAAISTGIALEIPTGYEGQIRPRSGRALAEGLALINSPGTIDADYRGEIMVLVINLGDRPLTIHPGDRIAQLIVAPVAQVELIEVNEIGASRRGGGGFGHTGN